MSFTPAVPIDVLVPLVWATILVCGGLFSLVVLRRVWILWRGRIEDALTTRVEISILRFLSGEIPPDGLAPSLGLVERKRIHALVRAVVRVETAGHADLRDRIRSSGLPAALAAVLGGDAPDRRRLGRPVDRWTRAAAARALGALGMAEGIPALERALEDSQSEVAYAAAGALAALDMPETAAAILRHAGKNARLNNARLAALVGSMTCDCVEALREALHRGDPVAAFWALDLAGEKRAFDLVEEARPFLAAEDANVRAAAAEALGRLKVPLTDRWVGPLLADPAWFVRCHAARALGDLKAVWAAPEIAALLEDREWWARTNGVEALVALGPEAIPSAENVLLASDDRFARQSAVDVLERLGWVEGRIERAAAGDRKARAAIEVFALSGGIGHVENALETAPDAALPYLLDLLADLGDDATYGRIRACLHRIPEALKPRALEVAAALKGV